MTAPHARAARRTSRRLHVSVPDPLFRKALVTPTSRPHHASAACRFVATTIALLSCLLVSGGLVSCTKSVTVGVPPGMAQDEAERMTRAVELSRKAGKQKDPDAAAELYRQAVLTYRELPSAWNNLGVVLMDQQKYLQAAEAFSTAADLSTADPRPLYNIALLYDRRGYLNEARRYYIDALARDDTYLPALRGAIRADSLLRDGDLQTLEWIKRALILEEDPEWLNWLRLQKTRVESIPALRYQSEPE